MRAEKGADPSETPLWQNDGAWKFLAGVLLGYCVKAFGSGFKPREAPQAPKKAAAAAAKRHTLPINRTANRDELKLVLVVNNSLGMGKGKIGAQCAHAACGVLEKYKPDNEMLFRHWEAHGQPKIALKGKDWEEMADLGTKALQAGLPVYVVHDAGRTQIPAGSQTVMAIGPGPKPLIDRVTGHLSLL